MRCRSLSEPQRLPRTFYESIWHICGEMESDDVIWRILKKAGRFATRQSVQDPTHSLRRPTSSRGCRFLRKSAVHDRNGFAYRLSAIVRLRHRSSAIITYLPILIGNPLSRTRNSFGSDAIGSTRAFRCDSRWASRCIAKTHHGLAKARADDRFAYLKESRLDIPNSHGCRLGRRRLSFHGAGVDPRRGARRLASDANVSRGRCWRVDRRQNTRCTRTRS